MMMPAKFSAIAENEMTYVIGGGSTTLGDFASTLAKNAWTIVGNNFVGRLVNYTLGAMFRGNYQIGNVLQNFGDYFAGLKGINPLMAGVGMVAAFDQLTNNAVSSVVGRWMHSSGDGTYWDMGTDRWIGTGRDDVLYSSVNPGNPESPVA
ncbi:MAG: hypothetical protein ACI4JC_03505 [Faecalibacterium sp.]